MPLVTAPQTRRRRGLLILAASLLTLAMAQHLTQRHIRQGLLEATTQATGQKCELLSVRLSPSRLQLLDYRLATPLPAGESVQTPRWFLELQETTLQTGLWHWNSALIPLSELRIKGVTLTLHKRSRGNSLVDLVAACRKAKPEPPQRRYQIRQIRLQHVQVVVDRPGQLPLHQAIDEILLPGPKEAVSIGELAPLCLREVLTRTQQNPAMALALTPILLELASAEIAARFDSSRHGF